ncbi:50S ribosomal protein L7ae [Clostridia bacterium]|nr:50S ribosomal protein L7ae [Clostridia bacterium]
MRVVGLKQSRKAVKDGLAVKVFIARDAEPHVREPFEALCKEASVAVEYIDTCAELGKTCGIDIGAAFAAEL